MEWSFVAVGPVQADIDLPAGEVNINPDAEGAVHVSLEPGAGGRKKADELIESSRVVFDGKRLEVHVPSRKLRNVELICTVALPAGSDLNLRTASADITCRGRVGRVTADLASGDISLGTAGGDIAVTSASGDVHCSDAEHDLLVKTASGDVLVGHVGGTADLSLASGDARIEDAAGSVRAETASGDVHIGRARGGEVRVRTASGDVTVLVSPGIGAYLDVSSVSGDMTCSLPVEESSAAEAALRILCQSVSGDVTIGSATP